MGSSLRLNTLVFLALAASLVVSGCHSNQQSASNENAQPQEQQPAADTANLAPVAAGGTGAATSQDSGYPQADENLPPQQDSADESDYGIQPEDTAPQPPPPLPDYDQPPCPGDGYIWTPGYWYYAPTGYYWVPGAWVQAPYQDALWTPGYWGYHSGRYAYFPGYWGQYIGFYGGIDYGFGYTGYGYRGGYWSQGHFHYNRAVNNVNPNLVHYDYNSSVPGNGTNRVSYNGGRGGIQVRPRLAELAALRVPHAPPMNTQIQLRQQSQRDRAQFASVNHGRPQQVAYKQPVAAEHDVRPVQVQVRNLPPAARPAPEAARGRTPAQPERMEPAQQQPREQQPNRGQEDRTAPPQSQSHPAEPARPETRAPQPNREQPQRGYPAQPERQPNAVQPRQPETRQPETRQPEAARPQETRPQQSRPEAARPAPQQHPQTRQEQPNRSEQRKPSPDHKEEPH